MNRAPFALLLTVLALAAQAQQAQTPSMQAVGLHLGGLKWRNIGPFRGGRVSAVCGIPGNPGVYYIGLPQGGVWKTTSAGQTWFPVFDAIRTTCSIGSVQVSPANPQIVYAGTGEISGGNDGAGIYKSEDAGATWKCMGLEATRILPSILVDPTNANKLLVAAAGRGGEQNDHLGVYRTEDGGVSWTRTLNVSDQIGIQQLAWDPTRPSIVYALSERRHRDNNPSPAGDKNRPQKPADVALYRSTDEGVTWQALTSTGLPSLEGRCSVAVAEGTNPQRLYLIGKSGLYRSDDAGNGWRRMAADDPRIANGQGDYSCGVYADSKNPDVVYTVATCVYRSLDGGKSFEAFKGSPGGDDPHDLWIDPTDGNRIILGGDQGAAVSLDAGATWGSWYNQPTGQFYHIDVDNQWPYWVFGTQQDSNSIATSSRGNLGQITPNDWSPHPGGEFGPMVADPIHAGVTYCFGTGGLVRVMFPSGQWTQINPRFHEAEDLRGPSGIVFSAGDPRELLLGTQYLLSSRDQGSTWQKLSPDLTEPPPPASPKDRDRRPPRYTIQSISASPLDPRIIWTADGSGRIELTQDHGKTWTEASISKLSASRARIQALQASGTNRSEAIVVTSRDVAGKRGPQIYRTRDFGQTWTQASAAGLPLADERSFEFVLRSDRVQPGLLFLTTGHDVFFSIDDGDDWQSLDLNLPLTQLSDLVVHGNDLVLATYGRGLWILDDFAPLRELAPSTLSEAVHLFKPAAAVRVRRNLGNDTPFPPEVPHAADPPVGAVIDYSLAAKPQGVITAEILDSHNRVIRRFSSAPIAPYNDQQVAVPDFWFEPRNPMPTELGLNRIVWNIRYETPLAFFHDPSYYGGAAEHDTPFAHEGPLALPGRYSVRLTVDGKSYVRPFDVTNDPRSPGSQHEMERMHEVQMGLLDDIQYGWDLFQKVDLVRADLAKVRDSKPAEDVAKAIKAFDDKLAAVGGSKVRQGLYDVPSSTTDLVGLNQYLVSMLSDLDYGDVGPTESVQLQAGEAWSHLKDIADKCRALNAKEFDDLNAVLAKHQLSPLPKMQIPPTFPPAPPHRYLPIPTGKQKST